MKRSSVGLKRLSEGLYRDKSGKILRFNGGLKKFNGRDPKKKRRKRNRPRGKEISIRQSASPAQLVYGRMRIGGVYTFLDTSADSHAYLQTGTNNNRVTWIAKTGGADGNLISVTLILSGTNPTLTVSVVGTAITVNLKSSSGTSQSTASQVVNAVRAHAPADALVNVHLGGETGAGLVQGAATTNLSEGGGTWFHQVVTLAGHEIDTFEAVYLDNRQVTFGGSVDPRWAIGTFLNKVFVHLQNGSDSQEAHPDLMAQLPLKWTSTDRQRGHASVYMINIWDPNLFETQPELSLLVRGKKCWDPRTGQTVWTRNAALIAADYLMTAKNRGGLGVSQSRLNISDQPGGLEWAADICDESVSLAGGGTEARYSIDCAFDSDEDPEDILNEMAQAMGGDIVRQNGRWNFFPGSYRAPSVTLTEDDLVGPIQITTKVSKKDNFNTVKGTYISPANNYEETDYPSVKNDTYITQDGGVLVSNINFPMVTSSAQCQRLAKIELERVRQSITVNLIATLKLLKSQVADTAALDLDKYGWSAKEFEITNMARVVSGADELIKVAGQFRETAEAVFDWNSGLETQVDPAPNTDLPDPFSADPPTNFAAASGTEHLYIRSDGSVQPRVKLTWTPIEDVFVQNGGHYEIWYKPTSSANWTYWSTVPGLQNYEYMTDVFESETFDFRIRSKNTFEVYSDYAVVNAHVVVGKTEKPSNVDGFAASVSDLGITITWNHILDLDRDQYELRFGATWETAEFIHRGKINNFLWERLAAGTYSILIKAIDTSGNYSADPATVNVDIAGPNPVRGFTASATGKSVQLDWLSPISSTLSVHEYDVYKGDTFATAVKIGTAFGTFHTYIEILGGTFTYWVVPVDVGRNRGGEMSAQTVVQPTDDFILRDEIDLSTEVVFTWMAVQGGGQLAPFEPSDSVYAPVARRVGTLPIPFQDFAPVEGILRDTVTAPIPLNHAGLARVETFEEWWDNNGWNTLQDAIDAGFDAWLSPSGMRNGYIGCAHDFGLEFDSTFLEFTWEEEPLQGTVKVIPSIAYSSDGVTFTSFVQANRVFATNFRYAFFRLDFYAEDIFSVTRVFNLEGRVQVQTKEETHDFTANSSDTDGTEIFFTEAFLDVISIKLDINSDTPITHSYVFADVPNPSSFKVLVWDLDGNRVTRSGNATVKGIIDPS